MRGKGLTFLLSAAVGGGVTVLAMEAAAQPLMNFLWRYALGPVPARPPAVGLSWLAAVVNPAIFWPTAALLWLLAAGFVFAASLILREVFRLAGEGRRAFLGC